MQTKLDAEFQLYDLSMKKVIFSSIKYMMQYDMFLMLYDSIFELNIAISN